MILGENIIALSPDNSNSNKLAQIAINDRPIRFSPDKTTESYSEGLLIVQVYELPSGAAQLYFPNHSLAIVYDGERIMLQARFGK